MAHYGLLSAFPAVRVAENKVNVGAKRFPYSVPLSFSNVLLRRFVQVFQNIAENISDCLILRKSRYIINVETLLGDEMRWSQV